MKRPTMKRLWSRLAAAAVGGAIIGFLIASLSYSPLRQFSELMHGRDYFLEVIFAVISRVLPTSVMRWIHSPSGVICFFVALGTAIGLSTAVIMKKPRPFLRVFIATMSFAVGAFCLAFLVVWLKTVLFSPWDRTMLTSAMFWLLISVLASVLVGLFLFFLLKQSRVITLAITALALLLSAFPMIFPSRSNCTPPGRPPASVLLIGIDAAGWNVIMPLLKEQKLPNIRRLMREGTYGPLRTTVKIASPIIWTSIVTGQRQARHGITGYVVKLRGSDEVLPISISQRKVNSLWDIAGQNKRRVDVINWYGSWPAEEINGCFVSNRFSFRNLEKRVYPYERLEEIESLLPSAAEPESLSIGRIGRYVLEKDRPDLFLAYFPRLDWFQHHLWKYYAMKRDSRVAKLIYGALPPDQVLEQGSVIEEEYIRLDGIIGDLMRTAPEDAAVFIVSDHGIGPGRGPTTFKLSILLEKLGWLSVEPDSRSIDWTKTFVSNRSEALESRRLPQEFLLNSREESPLNATPQIYPKAAFFERVKETLAGLRTASGRRFFQKIKASAEAETGRLKIDVWPNLRMKPDDEVVIGSSRLRIDQIINFDRLSGTHRIDGVIIAKGPGIKQGYQVKEASVLDITPTILYFLGLPVAKDMEGRVLKEVIDSSYFAEHPPKFISSYETGTPRKVPPLEKSLTDQMVLDHLRSLGYIR
jgi:predicted AlkP superfamily phosphohydrolase/phosphomutase